MSQLREGDNPCAYITNMIPDERGKVTIPPKKHDITVGPLDVRRNLMRLTGVEKISYKEINGKIYRIGKNGIEYPPISKEQFDTIKKLHKEYFRDDDEQEI